MVWPTTQCSKSLSKAKLESTSKLFTTFNLAIRFTGFTAELHAIFLGHLLKCRLEPSSCCIVLGIAETMHLQHMLVALEIRPTCRRNQHDQKLHQVLWFYPQHAANLQRFMRCDVQFHPLVLAFILECCNDFPGILFFFKQVPWKS